MPNNSTHWRVESLLVSQLTPAEARAIGQLLVITWPKPGVTVEDRVDRLRASAKGYQGPEALAPRSLVIRDVVQEDAVHEAGAHEAGRVLAHASVFPRTIETPSGELTIAALARVCTDSNYRGQHLGVAIVRAAFALVDEGQLPFSLFQTSVPVLAFYERLGCEVVNNRIYNSLGDAPEHSPFWDEIVMRYPASRTDWPTGDIDLRGPGY